MNTLLNKLKTTNEKNKKSRIQWLGHTLISMTIVATTLLIIDTDRFISISVFLFFFAFIGLIFFLFFSMMHAVKHRELMIKNSIEIIYKNYLEHFDIDDDYRIQTQDYQPSNWFLLPSYVNHDIQFALAHQNKRLSMYHASSYAITGSNQTRTYYFRGLYITLDGIDGDFQYRDKQRLNQQLIAAFSPLYKTDNHDVKNYASKKPFEEGMLYTNDHKPVDWLKVFLKSIRQFETIQSIRVGTKNNQLQVALELTDFQLPYVKRYKEAELDLIKKHVNLLLSILQTISNHST